MQLIPVDAHKASLYNSLTLDYLNQDSFFSPLISAFSSEEGYRKCMDGYGFPQEKRTILTEVLNEQYSAIPAEERNDKVAQHIALLGQEHTFTVTTGQQVHLLGGPLYVYLKALSTIFRARELKQQFPEKEFVAVFWMAGEDHDFEEINHVELFGKKYEAPRPEGYSGPCGRMPASIALKLIDELFPVFERDEAVTKTLQEMKSIYETSTNLATAFFRILNNAFGDEGLIVLNPDHPKLKELFLPVIRKEISEKGSLPAVKKADDYILQKYKNQATARDINLFLIDDFSRKAIHVSEENKIIIAGEAEQNEASLLKKAEENPAAFSPNVVLRPVYQQSILPNIVYFGGPGELAYWVQLKGVFDFHRVVFPIVELRNSVIPMQEYFFNKMSQFSWNLYQWITTEESDLVTEWLAANTGEATEPDWDSLLVRFDLLSREYSEKEQSLSQALEIERKNLEKGIEKIREKRTKGIKAKNDAVLKQLAQIKSKHFDRKKLQERSIPFFSILHELSVLKTQEKEFRQSRTNLFVY